MTEANMGMTAGSRVRNGFSKMGAGCCNSAGAATMWRISRASRASRAPTGASQPSPRTARRRHPVERRTGASRAAPSSSTSFALARTARPSTRSSTSRSWRAPVSPARPSRPAHTSGRTAPVTLGIRSATGTVRTAACRPASASATGVYLETLPTQRAGGAAFVTAIAPASAGLVHCQVASIRTSGHPQKIAVRCYDAAGHLKDAAFYLEFENDSAF